MSHLFFLFQSLDYDNSENQLFLEEERRMSHMVSRATRDFLIEVEMANSGSVSLEKIITVNLDHVHLVSWSYKGAF